MAFTKITDEDLLNKGVIGLPDTPGLSTSEMQAKFEQTAREVIVPKFNQLVDDLSNPSAASQIGANGKNRTVQGHIDNLENPHNVTAAQVGAYTKSETDAAISDRISQIGSADMTQAMYDPTGKHQDIFAYADSLGVNTYTHTKMDNVHHFNGSGASGRVKMTANVAAGDTVQVNGKTVPAYVGTETFADALAGEPVTGLWLTFTQDGEQINFNGGGGLSLTKLALATAETGDALYGKKFYSGDKTLKEGSILPRNTVGQNGTVGLSQFLTGVAVSKANSYNTQTNNNLDGVSRLCFQPPAGFYNGNTYVGETYANVASAIGLTAEKLMYGQQVLGITGTGTLQAGYSYRYAYNYDSKALAGSIFKKASSGKLAFAKSVSDLPMVIVGGGGDAQTNTQTIKIGSRTIATTVGTLGTVKKVTVSASANEEITVDGDYNGSQWFLAVL